MPRPTQVPYKGRMVSGTSFAFTNDVEPWVEYQLENGGVLKVRLVIGDIVVTDEKHDNGAPLVLAQSNVLLQYQAPAETGAKP